MDWLARRSCQLSETKIRSSRQITLKGGRDVAKSKSKKGKGKKGKAKKGKGKKTKGKKGKGKKGKGKGKKGKK